MIILQLKVSDELNKKCNHLIYVFFDNNNTNNINDNDINNKNKKKLTEVRKLFQELNFLFFP